jgi:hypothetical protein
MATKIDLPYSGEIHRYMYFVCYKVTKILEGFTQTKINDEISSRWLPFLKKIQNLILNNGPARGDLSAYVCIRVLGKSSS